MTISQEIDPIYRSLLLSDCRVPEGIEAQIVDPDDRPVSPGKRGLIRFRGTTVSSVLNAANTTEWPLREGWFYPGELAALTADGRVKLEGRSDDVMNLGHARFFSADTESALLAHPNVTAAAAFAWQNPETVVAAAAVTTSAPVAFDELAEFCSEQLTDYKVPEFVLFLPEMPCDEQGRTRKGKIRDILLANPPPRASERKANADDIVWAPGDDVWLETPNYAIRSLIPQDVNDRMLKWWADPEIVAPLKIQARTHSRETFVDHLNSFNNAERFFLGIFVKETGLHIGWWQIDYDPRTRVAILDVAIGDKSFQGRRIIDEMRNAIREFLFLDLGVFRIEAKIYVENVRSRRLAERGGYKLEAILASSEFATDGARRDLALYRLYESDWRSDPRDASK